MDEVNTSQNIQNAETGDFPENTAGSPVPSSELKSKKKKRIILGTVGLILVIVLVLTFAYIRGPVFSRAVHEMLSEYPYADNAITADNSCLMIDTNPYDKDYNEMSFVEQQIFPQKEQDSLNGINFMNTKLGFSDAVYRKMLQTSALMGRQSEENSKYRVSWTYHPDSGLEVMYEKK